MIRIHLLELLGRKHWTTQTTISEFAREIATSITLDNIDLICEALDCQPGDLMTFEPNEIPRIERNQQGEPIRPVKD